MQVLLASDGAMLDEITQYINTGSAWKAWSSTCHGTYMSTLKYPKKEEAFTNHLHTAVKMYPNYDWDYYELSRSYNTSYIGNIWDIVAATLDKPWRYEYLSGNPSITWDIVMANPDKPWDYHELSKNPSITWDIVVANPTLPWEYYYLSRNPSITWKNILDNPDEPWNYQNVKYAGKIPWRWLTVSS
jgi:hypothetical protein